MMVVVRTKVAVHGLLVRLGPKPLDDLDVGIWFCSGIKCCRPAQSSSALEIEHLQISTVFDQQLDEVQVADAGSDQRPQGCRFLLGMGERPLPRKLQDQGGTKRHPQY